MTSETLVTALNRLLNADLQAHQNYLAAAAWASEKNLDGVLEFLLDHAKEELGHAMKTFEFLDDNDARITIDAIEKPVYRVNDVTGLFREIAAHEVKVTKIINEGVELAQAEHDHEVFAFLQWFVNEQHEEEALFRSILDRIELVGDGPQALYFVDRELHELTEKRKAS
ncbi:ferritin [Pseudoxanthobacter soli DSM 19599]|uniref:Ferritin n=1 Tax=Pseudoxanthobacter soli DSM 19599 TaxID=1123029 RepID=A0A1M7Z612_9HYPH|nr:ferritin [Pseudoxanthobacter soli]SHO60220.1 ferritin [Pseudoxanthobacter soli DSM 19599]